MRKLILTVLLCLGVSLAVSACASTQPMGAHTYTSWAGKWQGVEGTYLTITPIAPRQYKIEIADLDGPRIFQGEDREHGIAFTRNGAREQITKGNGEQTGMKWLSGKRDCLVIKAGEGYCRD